jgi:hypothetical protein
MTTLSIQPTFPIFTDIDGQPLENGYVWIGVANLPAITNPITVYWDAALTIPAAQPIRTAGGYPMRSGTPARLYVNSDYSILVQNRTGSTLYSAPSATERYSDIVVSGVDSSEVTFLQAGAGAVTRTAQAKMREIVSVKDFGATGNGTTDDRPFITSAINSLSAGGTLYFPPGNYNLKSPQITDAAIVLPVGCNLLMDRDAWLISTQGIFNPTSGGSFIAPLGDNVIVCNIDGGAYPTSGGMTGTWATWANAGIRCYFSTAIGLGAKNVIVRDSEIKNVTYPLQIYGAQEWRVYANRFHRYKQSGVLAGFYSGYDCKYNIFSGNNFEDAGDYAIAFFQVGGEAAGVGSHNIVANNVAKNMNQLANGYAYGVEQGVAANQRHFLFANNVLENTVTSGASGMGGITVSTCTDSVVIGNVLKLAYNSNADTGIACSGSVNVLVQGNNISNSKTNAIAVTNDSTKVTISDNFIHNTGGTVSNYAPIIIGFSKGANNISIVRNTLTVDSTHSFYGAGVPAIVCAPGAEVGATIANVTIKDNVIINPNDYGIFIGGSAAIPASNCSVVGNQILGTQDATFFKRESIYASYCNRLDVSNNVIVDATRGIRLDYVTVATVGENVLKGTVTLSWLWSFSLATSSTGMLLRNNECTAPLTSVFAPATGSDTQLTTPANNNRAVGGSGLVVQNKGVTGLIASGATVNHGLSVTPTNVVIAPADTGVTDFFVDTLTSTTFKINYSGGGTHAFYWRAEF